MTKILMTGNEALARGAWEAGVRFASAYPGTPSTEILENLAALYPEVRAEWAPNEKVALEAAIGASLGGARALASMKHVGLNVAADPLFTISYTGINAGLVLISADEPGMHSSQNEQDNRWYAKMAKVPLLEPSDSQEALEFIRLAYDLSEEYDTPVLIRTTTRLAHSKSRTETGERRERPLREYVKNAGKYVAVPAVARRLRPVVEARTSRLAEYAETTPLNQALGSGPIGVIASGLAYYFAREVFGDQAAYLKLGFTWPPPKKKILDFCRDRETVYVIEENDPFLEEWVRALGIDCRGKDLFPAYGELTPEVIRQSVFGRALPVPEYDRSGASPRPPLLCAGCPHRGFFYELGRRKDAVVTGDIGCYTLGSAPPYNALDTTICMGASMSSGHGLQAALDLDPNNARRVVAVLGDSTFFHSGLASLLEVFYNGGRTINVILDNRITGMTGHQENPGSGRRADQSPAPALNLEALVRALGAENVKTVNPNNLAQVKETLDWAFGLDGPSVIITRWPCVLKKLSTQDLSEFGQAFQDKYQVDETLCVGCRLCLHSGCPAVRHNRETKKSSLDRLQCAGCGVCAQICPKGAIAKEAGR